MLGKLSVPGRPTSLDDSRARAYWACSRDEWGLFGHFFSHPSFFFSFSLSLRDGPIKTEIQSQRAVKHKTTNQVIHVMSQFGYLVLLITQTFLSDPVRFEIMSINCTGIWRI